MTREGSSDPAPGADARSALRVRLDAARLRAIQAGDRARLAWRRVLLPGLEIHAGASTNLAAARFLLEPGARVVLRAGVAADRTPGGLVVIAGPGALVDVGEGAWLRGELAPVRLVAFAGAELRVGAGAFLNGCHVSAKRRVVLGRRAFVGPGARVFDADQHDLDADRPERVEPVEVGDHAWIAADVTLLRGARVGAHCVIGARSLVTGVVPDHSLAFGVPARVRGPVGDRSATR